MSALQEHRGKSKGSAIARLIAICLAKRAQWTRAHVDRRRPLLDPIDSLPETPRLRSSIAASARPDRNIPESPQPSKPSLKRRPKPSSRPRHITGRFTMVVGFAVNDHAGRNRSHSYRPPTRIVSGTRRPPMPPNEPTSAGVEPGLGKILRRQREKPNLPTFPRDLQNALITAIGERPHQPC